jgi:hypothetical protein
LSAVHEFDGGYTDDTRIRWPTTRPSERHVEYRCVFSRVAEFRMRRSSVKVYRGKTVVRRDNAFHGKARSLDYLYAEFRDSAIRRKARLDFGGRFHHMRCEASDGVRLDIVFEKVEVKRVGPIECARLLQKMTAKPAAEPQAMWGVF